MPISIYYYILNLCAKNCSYVFLLKLWIHFQIKFCGYSILILYIENLCLNFFSDSDRLNQLWISTKRSMVYHTLRWSRNHCVVRSGYRMLYAVKMDCHHLVIQNCRRAQFADMPVLKNVITIHQNEAIQRVQFAVMCNNRNWPVVWNVEELKHFGFV